MATDLKRLLRDPSLLETRAYIAGEWVDADDGATFDVVNPARGDVIAEVADLSRTEVARAIFGRLLGSLIVGGVAGAIAYAVTASLAITGIAALLGLIFTLLSNLSRGGKGGG